MLSEDQVEERLRELLRDPRWSIAPRPGVEVRIRVAARRQRLRTARAATAVIAVLTAAIVVPLTLLPGGGTAAHRLLDTGGGRYPGAPPDQSYRGYVGNPCVPAPHNRYLPAHVGCLTVLRADIDGGRSRDLLMLYSKLSDRLVSPSAVGAKGMYAPEQVILEVVRPDGAAVSTPVSYAWAPGKYSSPGSAAIITVAHVNDDPGDEVFVQVGQTSSGSNAIAYGFYHGRLVPSGVMLGFGGDSGSQGRFDCLPGNPPRLVQRIFENGASSRYPWTEAVTTYAWHGPRLVQIAHHTTGLEHFNFMPGVGQDTGIGSGCVKGITPS